MNGMYLIETGYWVTSELTTKAMRAAYAKAREYNRKLVSADKIGGMVHVIASMINIAAKDSGGKFPVNIEARHTASNGYSITMNGNRDLLNFSYLEIMGGTGNE